MNELKLPTAYRQVTIGQLSDYLQATDDIGRVCAICRIKRDDAEALPAKTIQYAIDHIDSIVSKETGSMQMIVTIDKRPYGFIPELQACTTGEFVDFVIFADPVNFKQSVVKLMCLMYRPVIARVGNRYEIQPYDSTRTHLYEDDIRAMSAEVLGGALAFFLNLRNELLTSFRVSLERQIKVVQKQVERLQRKAGSPSMKSGERTIGSSN